MKVISMQWTSDILSLSNIPGLQREIWVSMRNSACLHFANLAQSGSKTKETFRARAPVSSEISDLRNFWLAKFLTCEISDLRNFWLHAMCACTE